MIVDYFKIVDHSQMKLGKRPQRKDRRTLDLRKYLNLTILPPTPISFSWDDPAITDWGMYGNDTIGDCTCASCAHQIMSWTDDNKKLVTPKEADIITAYSAVSGYDPTTGANDNGAVIIDVLNYWRNAGIGGDKILGYAGILPWMEDHLKKAIYLFGSIRLGAGLPIDAQSQNVWDVSHGTDFNHSGAPGSWGGHDIPVIGYNQEFVKIITWGAVKAVSWRWFIAYVTECYAVISMDFILNGQTPAGFDLALLQNDINLIGK